MFKKIVVLALLTIFASCTDERPPLKAYLYSATEEKWIEERGIDARAYMDSCLKGGYYGFHQCMKAYYELNKSIPPVQGSSNIAGQVAAGVIGGKIISNVIGIK